MSQTQPIDSVKRAIESVLPGGYIAGICFVYIASATVMSFLLYQPFFRVIHHEGGAMTAAIFLCVAIQFMRFLLVFTDSLTLGKNDSTAVVWFVSLGMLVLSVIEVFHATSAVQADTAVAVSCSSLMLAGCVLELLFVKKLNRRDTETEKASQATSTGAVRAGQQPSSRGIEDEEFLLPRRTSNGVKH